MSLNHQINFGGDGINGIDDIVIVCSYHFFSLIRHIKALIDFHFRPRD